MDKIYVVSYTHVSGEEAHIDTRLKKFDNHDEALDWFKELRIFAIRYVREDSEDEDEETRDVSVKDTHNQCDYLEKSFIICHDDNEMVELKLRSL